MTVFRNGNMRIQRNTYLDRVIESRHNGMIKIVAGVRRSGKSYLLFNLFYDWPRRLRSRSSGQDRLSRVLYPSESRLYSDGYKEREPCGSLLYWLQGRLFAEALYEVEAVVLYGVLSEEHGEEALHALETVGADTERAVELVGVFLEVKFTAGLFIAGDCEHDDGVVALEGSHDLAFLGGGDSALEGAFTESYRGKHRRVEDGVAVLRLCLHELGVRGHIFGFSGITVDENPGFFVVGGLGLDLVGDEVGVERQVVAIVDVLDGYGEEV